MRWHEFFKKFSLSLASTLLLFISGMAIPLAGVLLLPLVPQPSLAMGLNHGRLQSLGVLAASLLALFWIGGKELALGFAPVALMVALLLFFFGRGWSIESVAVSAAGGMLAVLAAASAYFFGSLSRLREVFSELLRQNLEISFKIYEQVGLPARSLEMLRERAPQTIDMILSVLPALVFAAFLTVILFNLYFLYRRFPARRSAFSSNSDLREWKSPEPLVWCFIGSGFAMLLPWEDAIRNVALNIFLVVGIFYFLQGIAIVAYYFHHKNVPVFLRGLSYVLIVLEQVLTVFVAVLGLFDLWGDFRRLKKKDLNPGSVS